MSGKITNISFYIICLAVALTFTLPAQSEIDDDGPMIGPKSSILALKLGMDYLEHRSNDKFMQPGMPIPLMDKDYFAYGDWAFYADSYFDEIVRPSLNGHGDMISLKPLDLASRKTSFILQELDSDRALVRVEYPRHEELERLLQKLYFNLIRGPVILSVAYDPLNVPNEYKQYSNWQCFSSIKDPSVGEDGDVHIVYVDWSKVHSVVAYLDGGAIRVADNGRIYDVDHNALVAQANAILAMPDAKIISENGRNLNYLLYMDEQKVAQNK
jgi:hypothetical protein